MANVRKPKPAQAGRYQVAISPDVINAVTDEVLKEVREW